MHFDWTIRPYDIFVFGSALFVGIRAWLNHQWRIKNLEDWKDTHFHTTEEVLKNITLLREAVVRLEAIAAGQERRITFVENHVEWNHTRAQ